MLPPELVALVCSHLPNKDLKAARRVCRTYEQAAAPYLFDTVFLSFEMADLRIAKLVADRFKHYIHTLVFSSYYYEPMDEGEFADALDIKSDATGVWHWAHLHLEYGHQLYCNARKTYKETLQNGSCAAYLALILASSANVRKIILTDTESSRSIALESLREYESRPLKCPVEGCVQSNFQHYGIVGHQSGFSLGNAANPWRAVILGLTATRTRVEELTMEPGHRERATETSAFKLSPGDLGQAKVCFAALTKIRLSLDLTRSVAHRNVAKLLRSAINLECLALDTLYGEWDGIMLHEVLARCKFGKLKSLNLAFFHSTKDELLGLVEHSRGLEHITLDGHTLTSGSWMHVAKWIRSSLPLLKSAEMNYLYRGFSIAYADTVYMDVYGRVGDFLFANGKNPFTTKAIKKYRADRQAGLETTNRDGGLGFFDRYRMFH